MVVKKLQQIFFADRLLLLEAAGIIRKQKHPESKAKVLYTLTPKGIDLVPALVEIIVWSENYHEVHPHAKQFAEQLRNGKEAVVKQILASLK